MKLVPSVKTIDANGMQGIMNLHVNVIGHVHEVGWTDFTLEEIPTKDPAKAGIYELKLVGNAPTGKETGYIEMDIGASKTFPLRSWMERVRVHAEENDMDADIKIFPPVIRKIT